MIEPRYALESNKNICLFVITFFFQSVWVMDDYPWAKASAHTMTPWGTPVIHHTVVQDYVTCPFNGTRARQQQINRCPIWTHSVKADTRAHYTWTYMLNFPAGVHTGTSYIYCILPLITMWQLFLETRQFINGPGHENGNLRNGRKLQVFWKWPLFFYPL